MLLEKGNLERGQPKLALAAFLLSFIIIHTTQHWFQYQDSSPAPVPKVIIHLNIAKQIIQVFY